MSDIPSELFRDILLRVPAEPLFRFRAVCREWRRLIDDPSFVRSHTDTHQSSDDTTILIRNSTGAPLYLLSLDTLNLNVGNGRQPIHATPIKQLVRRGVPRLRDLPVASCNGLMLLSDNESKKIWAIWNPLTRECHELPPRPDAGGAGLSLMGNGLGYDPVTDDYKVVRIDIVFQDGLHVYRTVVYSMKLGGWRVVKDCPHRFTGNREGVYLKGAVHWLSRDFIIAFDVATEDYRLLPQLPLPPWPPAFELGGRHLDAMGGCLVMSYSYLMIDRFDGWVMKEYGVEKSWERLFSLGEVDTGELEMATTLWKLRPVAYLNGKKQVLLQHDSGFLALDVEDGSVKNVTIHGHKDISSAQICPGSLVRLGDGGNAAANATSGVKRKRKKKRSGGNRLTFCVRGVNDGYCSDLSCCGSSASGGED